MNRNYKIGDIVKYYWDGSNYYTYVRVTGYLDQGRFSAKILYGNDGNTFSEIHPFYDWGVHKLTIKDAAELINLGVEV